MSYCPTCRVNLSILCQGHKEHKRIFFADELPEKKNLIEKKNKLKNNIYLINNDIKVIINILNEIMNKINIYYKINEYIIDNYDDKNKNRNYETIYYLNQIINNDNYVKELDNIVKFNNIKDKFNNILNIYSKMNIDEINIIYKVEDIEVKLFGDTFVKNNKNNCKLIVDGKEQELKTYYTFGFFSTKKDTLEIKLKGITNITNISLMFNGCSSLLSLPDISKWNTSNVTNMSGMFNGCKDSLNIPEKFKK